MTTALRPPTPASAPAAAPASAPAPASTVHEKRWIMADDTPTGDLSAQAQRLGISPFLAALLWRRGLRTPADIEAFLFPHLRGLAPLAAWPGVPQATSVLLDAVADGTPVLVWGDYDVDGVTATTLCLQVLEFHGVPVSSHLPDRQLEGYGLNIPTLERLAAEGVRTLLTVDCGISDVEPIARARELGLRTVISDHHLPPAVLPPADAICNPRLADCPCPHLAGVGMAFFLMASLNAALATRTGRRMDMREVLDVVTLGTLADVVPITGQNRILVKNGLLMLSQATRPGVAELKAVSGYAPGAALGAGQVVFNLAPRLNAAGRLGSATRALDLLRAPTHDAAADIAKELNTLNIRRRDEEDRILEIALQQAETQTHRMGLVVWGDDWHQGVIGIVASRLVERLYRPTLVLCAERDTYKGSGRSIAAFDLHAGLEQCASILLSFGGHRQAAGLRVTGAALEQLRDRFDAVVRAELGDTPLTPPLRLDAELDFSLAADFDFLKSLEQLQPYGVGNPEPVFASPPLLVRSLRRFGPNRDHLTLSVTDTTTGVTLQAKLWRQADAFPLSIGARLRLAYTPGINAYNGVSSVELRIKDWQVLP